jgi:hypothetical protein
MYNRAKRSGTEQKSECCVKGNQLIFLSEYVTGILMTYSKHGTYLTVAYTQTLRQNVLLMHQNMASLKPSGTRWAVCVCVCYVWAR